MRTKAEIDRAAAHIRDAIIGGREMCAPQERILCLIVMLRVLVWAGGSNEPGGFGEVLADLDSWDDPPREMRH